MADDPESTRHLKDYVDAKFETIIHAAEVAQRQAVEALAKAEEQNKRFAERAEVANLTAKLESLIEAQAKYLTQGDYNLRHEALQQKMDEALRTPWPTYGSFGMILLVIIGGFWGLAYGPIQTRFMAIDTLLVRLEDADRNNLNKLEAELAAHRQLFVQQVEYKSLEKRFDEKNHTQDERIGTLLTQDSFRSWEGERNKLIGQIEARIERLYDIIDKLQARQAEVEGRLRTQIK